MENQNSFEAPAQPSAQLAPGALIGPGSLLKYAWNVFKSHWKILISVLIIPQILLIVGMVPFALMGDSTSTAVLIPMGLLAVVIMIAGGILSVASTGALIRAIHDFDLGGAVTIKEEYRFGFKIFWSMILISLISSLVTFGSYALLIIPGIIVSGYTCFSIFTLVVDGRKGFDALTESWRLVRDRWWPVVGRLIVIGLVYFAVVLIVSGLQFLIKSSIGLGTPYSIIRTVLDFVVYLVMVPIFLAYFYKLYQSLKSTAIERPTQKFKNWLVAFVAIGIIAIIVGFMTIPLLAINSARLKAEQAKMRIQAEQQLLETELQQSSQN